MPIELAKLTASDTGKRPAFEAGFCLTLGSGRATLILSPGTHTESIMFVPTFARRFGVQILFVALCSACTMKAPSSATTSNEGVVARPEKPKASVNPVVDDESIVGQFDHDDAWLLQIRAAYQITAADLLAQFQANEVGADRDFKGRTVLVRGVVREVGRGALNQAYVSLKSGQKFDIFCVQAIFPARSESQITDLQPGTLVWIIGKCAGKSLNVLLEGAQIVSDSDLTRKTSTELADASRVKAAKEEARKQHEREAAAQIERERPARELQAKQDREARELQAKQAREDEAARTLTFVMKSLSSPDKRIALATQLRSIVTRYPDTPAADEAAKILKNSGQ